MNMIQRIGTTDERENLTMNGIGSNQTTDERD
jgi:hypothetical protein